MLRFMPMALFLPYSYGTLEDRIAGGIDRPLQLPMAENQPVIDAFTAVTSHPEFGDCIAC
jgi:hypothetical protein